LPAVATLPMGQWGMTSTDTSMASTTGPAAISGELWGARARDWAQLHEHLHTPLYQAVSTPSSSGRQPGCWTPAAAQEWPRPWPPTPPPPWPSCDGVANPGAWVLISTWANPATARCVRCSRPTAAAATPPPGAGGPFGLSEPGRLEALVQPAGLTRSTRPRWPARSIIPTAKARTGEHPGRQGQAPPSSPTRRRDRADRPALLAMAGSAVPGCRGGRPPGCRPQSDST
jgi:hypothetical protein